MRRTDKELLRKHMGEALDEMGLQLRKQLTNMSFGDEAAEYALKRKLSSQARAFYSRIYCKLRGDGLTRTQADRRAWKATKEGYGEDIESQKFAKKMERMIIELGELKYG